jgi:dihydrodipicolinate synthase/N-acetylneuraminate lyase
VIHLAPRTFVELHRAVRSGEDEYADSIQAGIDRMMDLVFGCLRDRPESSTLFHMLNVALMERGVCDNILLDHDGDAPDGLLEKARRAIVLGKKAIEPVWY